MPEAGLLAGAGGGTIPVTPGGWIVTVSGGDCTAPTIAVIVVVPGALPAVIFPLASIVATLGLLDEKVAEDVTSCVAPLA